MTERLYYTDPYLSEFEADLLRVQPLPDGRPAAILDRTAFYPTSGGQPFDTGTLGATRVIDVIESEDGTILHVLQAPLPSGRVTGRIDWDRRFEHMQQHTGQHLLSAAFDRLLGAKTMSFHLGSESSTIDLSKEVPAGEIAAAESEANRIVWENHGVGIRFVDAAEAASLPLRKEASREGRLRLIEIGEFDLSACGGTHVARTGAVGIIATSGWERFRGGTRVAFLCGVRALRGCRALRDTVTESVRLVSVLPAELPAGIARLQAEAKDQKRRLKDLQGRLAAFEAGSLAARAEPCGPFSLVVQTMEGWDLNGLKTIASAIAARPGHVAILLGLPPPVSIAVARAAGAPLDAAAVLKQLTDAFGGKGGGRPELAQGGGLEGSPDDLVARAREIVLSS
ncbi:MAG TPA: DHHA1 domain-containing protein [Vicinamibacterales bacterium]|nr:DHHA1 domain-containing protein [Vicinamibacterales bacterium]